MAIEAKLTELISALKKDNKGPDKNAIELKNSIGDINKAFSKALAIDPLVFGILDPFKYL